MISRHLIAFVKKIKQKKHIKLHIFIISTFIILLSSLLLLIKNYNLLINNFKSEFNSQKYINANSLLVSKSNYNPIKALLLDKDLSEFFTDKLTEISNNLANKNINDTQAINIISEIKRYNVIDKDLNSMIETLHYEGPYNDGITLYNSAKYIEAYNVFSTIASSDINYDKSLTYINNCKENIKIETIQKADELCNDDYYTKALEEINNIDYIIGNDPEIKSKITEIKNKREDYLAMQSSNSSIASSSSIINSISTTTINNLAIESNTKYLIHVDLSNQKTYIYTGSVNNWTLAKTFICSTGIKGEETPEGIYEIGNKGEWFFSDTYKQGGKYWVQFSGNYLFHSLPYDEDKNTIVDFTLGTPSSHGCVRLAESDSKWIYDSIPENTKVIIK